MPNTPKPEEQTQRLGGTLPHPLASSDFKSRREPAAELLLLGDVVNGRFEVNERIGSGSLGVVYRVHDRTMGEARALKALHPAVMKSERARERFVNQIRLALRLAHPGLVRVHDYSDDRPRNLQYFTMEYVRGISLDRLLQQRGGRLPIEEVLVIGEKIADALAHAHQFTIHRDLKPQNVMLDADNQVKVLDFGLAQLMTRAQFSQSAMVMGTAYYQAPEIHLRQRTVDQRADIYSLGVLLYEMAVGSIPQGNFPLPSEVLPEVPRAFNRIITGCLAPAVEDRFQTAGQLAEALRRVSSGDKGGRLASLVQAVRDRAALLTPKWQFVHEAADAPEPQARSIEPETVPEVNRFEIPTAVLVDEDAAQRARQAALDAMEAARAAGAEEHAARRFATACEMLEEAAAPMAANLYSKAIAEYEAATRAFETIAKRVEVVKAEKARLSEVLDALKVIKAAPVIVAAKRDATPEYVAAREFEVRARQVDTRPEAIALLEHALEAYIRLVPDRQEAIDTPVSEILTPEEPAAPAEDVPEEPGVVVAPEPTVPAPELASAVPLVEGLDTSQPDVDETAAKPTIPISRASDTANALDMTMPARGLKVDAASMAPPAEPPSTTPEPTPSAAAPVPEPESRVLLVPDEYSTVQAAIDAAKTGDTVRIRPGIYDEHLVLKNGIKVIGENRKTVIIRAPGGHASVAFAKNCRTGLLSGVTLEHSTSKSGDARYGGIKLHNSSIGVFRCVIQRTNGSGVIIKAGGSPTIRECLIQDNPWPGIHVRGEDSAPLLKGNTCIRNGGRGIFFERGARGRAIENECRENQGSGISVYDAGTAPELRQNTCTQNTEYGMYFGRGASGVAEENTCSQNGISGISVHDAETAPHLRRNTCAENTNDGIYFGDASGGIAEANMCTRNREDGIFVRDPSTAPHLIGNHCLGNSLRGIEVGFGAQGVLERNRCEANAKEGIRISNHGTAPKLANNECIDNGTRGIYYSKGAAGVAEGNLCEGNKEIGLAVAHAGTCPTLRANRLYRNGQYGIFIDRDATPTLDGNEWSHNGIADIYDDRAV